MKSETISQVMLGDHNKIVKLLNDFGNCTNLDKKILKKAFELFKWELEKHLFTEEKAIFISYEPKDQTELPPIRYDLELIEQADGSYEWVE